MTSAWHSNPAPRHSTTQHYMATGSSCSSLSAMYTSIRTDTYTSLFTGARHFVHIW